MTTPSSPATPPGRRRQSAGAPRSARDSRARSARGAAPLPPHEPAPPAAAAAQPGTDQQVETAEAPSYAAASGPHVLPAMPGDGARSVGRIPVVDVSPVLEAGRWPAKAVVGEAVEIGATVFREGHDAVAATAVLVAPDGTVHSSTRMTVVNKGLDTYRADLVPDAPGRWSFRVEGWSDPFGTWEHDATIKVAAGVDVELMLAAGAALLDGAAGRPDLPTAAATVLTGAAAALRDTALPPQDRLAAALAPEVHAVLADHPVREHVSPSQDHPLLVQRERALVGAWYELFPRSEGAVYDPVTRAWRSGTLRTAATRLPAIAQMGFDVVYLTPIHPIGTTHRKGRNNALTAAAEDPGSPYAIGSADGGHDAIHPDLGTFDDFDAFVARAREHGLEVALDLALQCSPDHPWVTEHPEWFTTRLDGTIAYAENPPKKYQDIYPLNFDNDPAGIYAEVRRVLQVWIDHGVTAFRVDNPHTKPLEFWEWLIADVNAAHPDVIFLAEAFTRPAMMHTLAKIGFHQSYTYFTWRNTRTEIEEYLTEVSGAPAAYMRPSFWPTTHDILTPYMQHGGPPAFAIRAILAATGSPTWGVYSGYELVENVPRPGAEEQIDNEKYEFKPRNWFAARQTGIPDLLGRLNAIRREHPALQRLRGLTVHPTSDDATVCYSRRVTASQSPTGTEDVVLVIVNTDPHHTREAWVQLDLEALGATPAGVRVRDLISGETFEWDASPFVRLDPWTRCGHVLAVEPL